VADARWELKPYSEDLAESHVAVGRNAVGRSSAQCTPLLQYTLNRVWLLEDPFLLPADFQGRDGPVVADYITQRLEGHCFQGGGSSVDDISNMIGLTVSTLLVLEGLQAASLHHGVSDSLVHSVALGARLPRGGVPAGLPAPSLLQRLRRLFAVAPQQRLEGPEERDAWQSRYNDKLLEMPRGLRQRGARDAAGSGARDAEGGARKDKDPLQMLRGLGVAQYLRSSRFFTKVMAAAKTYDAPSAPAREGEEDPHRVTFDRAAAKLDIVDLLLERRAFRADREFDCVKCIQIYSDSSPVTGEELQGMLMDVHYNDGRPGRRATFPGSSLWYGQFGAIPKAVAVLWGCFLLCGPLFADMRWWLSKVSAVLTDAGTERHTIEMPDILLAFLRWNAGAALADCALLVAHGQLLFPRALRIFGWCHGWSNIMKSVAAVCPVWERVLDQMRSLISFWRDRTWRKWVQKALQNVVDPKLFRKGPTSVAKWRYGTIPHAMGQLLPLREVHERYLCMEMFANAQDKEEIKKVIAASKDKDLWIFMQASYTHVFTDCEQARHWGMCCNCPEHVRLRREEGKKHIECFRNGRRLKETWPFLCDLKQTIFNKGCTITRADCEGHNDIWQCIKTMLYKSMTQIDQRFGYFSRLPFIIVRCTEVEGAQEFMRQLGAKPLAEQDLQTRGIVERVGADIEARSRGEALTPALQDEVSIAEETPEDESCGEGYHRQSHYEQSRAPSSTATHIKQANRFKTVLAKTERFIEQHGARGEAVVRFEWRAGKRILQTTERRRWYPVKDSADAVVARVYREDDRAQQDFAVICARVEISCKVEPEKVDGKSALQHEYLVSTIKPNGVYSITPPQPTIDVTPGVPPAADHNTYFHLLETAHGRHRPDFMSVADPGADVALQAGMAMLVVFLVKRPADGADHVDEASGAHNVYAQSAPVWVRPGDLGNPDSWYRQLYRWSPTPGDDQPGTLVIKDRELVFNRVPYASEECPTIAIAWKLKRSGWRGAQQLCIHDRATVANFDSYPAVKMKTYYQVLLSIGKCLGLTSVIPSRQPILFYKMLLAGQRVEPHMGHQAYLVLWKGLLKDGKVPDLALEPPSDNDDPDPIEDGSDDDVLAPSAQPKEPPKKRRRVDAPAVGSGRGKGVGKGPPLPLPPGPPPVLPPIDPVPVPPVIVVAPVPPEPPPPIVLPPPGPPVEEEVDDDVLPVPVEQPRIRPVEYRGDRWTDGVGGYRVRFDPDYVTPGGIRFSANWQIKCLNPHHRRRCAKKVHVSAGSTSRCGDIEPLAFLHVWGEMPVDDNAESPHSRQPPPEDAVVAYAAAHGEELREVLARGHALGGL